MQIELNDLFTFLFSFFGGGGLGFVAIKLFMQKEAKEAVKGDLIKIEESIKDLKAEVTEAVGKMANDYVTCKFCNMQHENLNTLLKCMDDKLDVLIDRDRK